MIRIKCGAINENFKTCLRKVILAYIKIKKCFLPKLNLKLYIFENDYSEEQLTDVKNVLH